MLKSLGDLVETGEQIIAELSTQDVSAADKHNKKIGESLDSVEENIDKIFNPKTKGQRTKNLQITATTPQMTKMQNLVMKTIRMKNLKKNR